MYVCMCVYIYIYILLLGKKIAHTAEYHCPGLLKLEFYSVRSPKLL